jgi:hypothetical protein
MVLAKNNGRFTMSHSRAKSAFLHAVFAVVAVLGGAGSAQAAVYTGHWDPPYGGIFPDLGWKGSATFILPDACLGLTGSFANAAAGCGGGGMQVLGATLEFYNSTTDPAGLNVLETLHLGNAPLVNGMTIATVGGVTNLLGAETGFFNPVKGSIPEAEFGGNDYYFHLILTGNTASLVYTLGASDSPGCALFAAPGSPFCGISQTPAHTVFTPAIPEPSTYALFGAGLMALWSMRRRLRVRPTARGLAG